MRKILLVEDNPTDIELFKEIVATHQRFNYRLETVTRLAEAAKRLQAGDIGLVLLDLSLPDSVGINTFTQLHAHAPHVPIVLLTGLKDVELADEAVRRGAQDYFVKDWSSGAPLVQAIRYAIERHRIQEELQQRTSRETLLRELAVTTNEANDIHVVLQQALVKLSRFLSCVVGRVFIVAAEYEALTPRPLWHGDDDQFREFRQATEDLELPQSGNGLLRRAIADGEPGWIEDITAAPNFIRAEAAAACGLKTGIAVPILVSQNVVAVLELFATATLAPEPDTRAVLKLAGIQLGRALERKKAELDLRRREERFRSLIQDSSDLVSIFDEQGIGIYHSPAIKRIMGYPANAIEGLSVFEVIHPEDVALVNETFRRLMEQPEVAETIEVRLRHADASWRWLEARLFNQLEKPAIRGIIVNSRNITERKRTEQEKTRLHRELRFVYDSGAALSQTLELPEICRTLYDHMRGIDLDTPHFVVATYDSATREISCRFAIVDGEEQSAADFPTYTLGEGPTSDAIRSRKIQIVAMEEVRRRLASTGRVVHVGDAPRPRSGLYVPLISGDTVRGVASFQSYEPHAYDEVSRSLVSTIATQAAVALENGLLYQQLQEHAGQLETRVRERTTELKRLNERMAAVLNNTSDGILLVAFDNLIEMANPGFERLFGFEPGAIIGQPLTSITYNNHRDTVLEALNETREGTGMKRLQVKCVRPDSSTFDAELALAGVPENENHIVCTIFDISQYKAVEQMKNNFISTVNHEIRTPITGIVLNADTLRKYYDHIDDAQRLRKIEQIRQQGSVMVELINAILDLARLEEKTQERGTMLVDVGRAVTDVVDEMRPEAVRKKQSLRLNSTSDSVSVVGDPTDLSVVFRNLIGNAIKYTPEGGEIVVALHAVEHPHALLADDLKPGSYLVGQVVDNGPGMTKEDLEQIFTRFYRGWAKHSKIPGTGLGLALVRETLELYDGDIDVASTPGEGSTFTLRIPLDD